MITLVKDTIDNNDIDRLIDWLKTYPRLTKGKVTLDFEQKFTNWLGRKYSVYCNSGSSANLLMLSALQQGEYLKNNKIVVPSVAWATDLAPVIQLGLEPILCDSNFDDLALQPQDDTAYTNQFTEFLRNNQTVDEKPVEKKDKKRRNLKGKLDKFL